MTRFQNKLKRFFSHVSSCQSFACLKLHHAAKKTKYKTRSISEYYVTNNQATHRLKKETLLTRFKMQIG